MHIWEKLFEKIILDSISIEWKSATVGDPKLNKKFYLGHRVRLPI